MELAVFLLFAALTLGSATVVVLHRNPIYSVMSMVLTLVSLAVLFVLLGAPFIAALQVLLYTGAILVLFLFVIMLLNVQRESSAGWTNAGQVTGAALAALVFAGIVGWLSWGAYGGRAAPALSEEAVALRPLAELLFSVYLLPFEIIGLLLLVAVVAATVVARRPEPPLPGGEQVAAPEGEP
jgi:NADH-quinone oxidoreductase subunit J